MRSVDVAEDLGLAFERGLDEHAEEGVRIAVRERRVDHGGHSLRYDHDRELAHAVR